MFRKKKIKEEINVENDKSNYILPLGVIVSLLITFIIFDNIYVQQQQVIDNKDYKFDKANVIETNQKVIQYKSIQEIIQNEKYSQFIPRKWIEGYNYENGTLTQKDNVQSMHLSYTKNYGYVEVNIREINNISNYYERVVDISDTHKYDITQYEIPFAQSVPQELRVTIEEPIFNSSQISEDALKMRVIKLQERGESEKQTMRFGVACEDIIIDYNISYYGKDNLAKKAYEMLMSTPYFENERKL